MKSRTPRNRKVVRTAVVLLGMALLTPGVTRPEPKKPHVDSMLQRMMRTSEKAVREHGRVDAIPADDMAFFTRVVAADNREGRPRVRVRLELDARARATLAEMGIKTYGRMAGFASAVVPMDRLSEVAEIEGVQRMQAVRIPKLELDISKVETGSTAVATTYGASGAGVIYAAIDSGVNFTHQDFRNADGTTRIKYLWNQDENSCSGTPPPAPFDFGCLYTEAQINAALIGGPGITGPDADGHGTHTTGVGAGNGRGTGNGRPAGTYVGMASQADIIFVKIFPEPTDTNGCADCFAISDAMDFIDTKAAEMGKPYVINMSFGSQYGAHDGSDIDELTIDALTGPGIPGKATVKSAGNERGHRIHFSGTLGQGLTNTHTIVIPNYTPLPGTLNDTVAWTVWYSNGDTLTVRINDPSTAACQTGVQFVDLTTGEGEDFLTTNNSGTLYISEIGSPLPNGTRYFDAEIDDGVINRNPCPNSSYQFQLTGTNITAGGRYDGWIWYNGFGSAGAEALWNAASADLTNLLSVPGSAKHTTTVGAYATKPSWTAADGLTYQWNPPPGMGTLASFSSPGPTRDGRIKPEITAPGFGVSSTLSINATPLPPGDQPLLMPDTVHWILPGTSFSAPHVAGIYAQLLSMNRTLDAVQLRHILTTTARVDAVVTPPPNNDWGFGKVGALQAANLVNTLNQFAPAILITQQDLFSFVGTAGASSYNVYRGLLSAKSATNYGTCFQSGLTGNSFNDASNPPLGDGYMYYMTAKTGGVEGSLGNRSNGTPRPNLSPCP